jgi:hypothetical protein
VPEAQLLGDHEFAYAVWVGAADPSTRLRDSAAWRRPLANGQPGVESKSLLDVGGLGYSDGALMGALDGDGLVLRVVAGPGGASLDLPGGLEAEPCRLDETPVRIAGRRRRGRRDQFDLSPAAIASWRLPV